MRRKTKTPNSIKGKNFSVFTEKHFSPNENFSNYLHDHKHKKGIIITGRVHPGESNSSFVVEGIINFLLSNCKEAVHLRNNFVFKILPMINPDGVIYGNYRCSLLGVDLNRRWNNPSKILHPIIYNAKQLVKMLETERGVSLFTDIHGHSRKKNVFMYGCNVNNFEPMSGKSNDMIRLLPFMINERNKLFSYKD
jgi:murein tripeptide amidase MpaA